MTHNPPVTPYGPFAVRGFSHAQKTKGATITTIADYAAQIIASAPPLNDDIRARLTTLFRLPTEEVNAA